jgi:hypothetical protein
MAKLSKESANRLYEKLLAIYYFKYLTLAQKVSIFYQDLEHDILKKITEKKEFFDQLNWLKDNQIYIDHGKKTGSIPPTLVSNIHNFKIWRNEAVHGTEKAGPLVDPVTYLNLFQTMIKTINFFSEIPIPDEINSILAGKSELSKPGPTNGKPQNDSVKLGENGSRKVINEELFLNLDRSNSVYSSINARVSQWSFTIDNSHFNNNLYFILEDQNNKKLYCFLLKKGTIKNPKDIFNQRNDERRKNASIIIIPTNDKNFTNNWQKKEFQFIKYIIYPPKTP